jgi:hypothetical protein
MTTAKKSAETPPQADAPLPVFYTKPVVLDAALHADLALARDIGFGFAAKVNALPLNIVEFPQAAHFYPIAFARDAAATPVVVTGVRDNENLFVNEKGEWTPNTYIPAYVRRYPFILSESPDKQTLSLCVDDAAGILVKGGADKFFDDKKQPTQISKNAMEFCRSYHMASQQTAAFGQALQDAGVLTDRSAELTVKGGQRISFSGFRIIDEEKFNKLSDKTLIEWRNNGWLAAAYAHLFSGLRWGEIVRLVNERI